MAVLCALTASAAGGPARAARSAVSAFRRGAFCGQIIDAASGKPVADATVAVRDRHGRVVAWTRTDAQGHYTLAADSLGLLDLNEPHRRGMLATLGRGMVQVVEVPVKVVGVAAGAAAGVAVNTLKSVDPIGTVKAALVSAAEGSPMPLAQKATGDVAGILGMQTRTQARDTAAQTAVNKNYLRADPPKKTDLVPGEVSLLVSAPQYKPFGGAAGSYGMAPPTTEDGTAVGPQAWLDTVRLSPVAAKPDSDTQDEAAHLCDPTLDPAMAAAGAPVHITVKLQTPADSPVKACVVAREQRTHQVAELTPQGNGVYAGDLRLDPKTPVGDTVVTVAALNAAPVGVDLHSGPGDDPVLSLASHLEALDTDKPYHFDPRLMVSENRLDLKMMVLDPKQETPPDALAASAAAPAAPVSSPAPAGAPPTAPSGSGKADPGKP